MCNTRVVTPTGPLNILLLRELVRVFALLYIQFRLARFHLVLDYIRLALFLFFFSRISTVTFLYGDEC